MNYYQRHIGDYARDAGHLTMLEHGAYSLLLDNYYVRERGIPNNEDLFKLIRAKTDEEKSALNYVLNNFFTLKKGCWINKRAEEEIKKTLKKIKSAKTNGKVGGRPKLEKNNDFEKKLEKKNSNSPSAISGVASDKIDQKPTGLFLETGSVNLAYENETQPKAPQTPNTTLQTPNTNIINTTPPNVAKFTSILNKLDVALKLHGVDLINLNNPKLHDLLKKGATITDFLEASRIAKEKKKGLSYLFGIVERKSKKSFQKFSRHHEINLKNLDEGVNDDGSF